MAYHHAHHPVHPVITTINFQSFALIQLISGPNQAPIPLGVLHLLRRVQLGHMV